LVTQTVTTETGPLFKQEYAYDKAGNLIRKDDSVLGTDRFFYDPVGRIIRQIDPVGQAQQYLYDKAGDSLNTAINASAPDDPDFKWERTGELAGQTYRSDRAGNLFERTDAQGKTEFVWDVNGRLIESISGGHTTTYRYDPLGRRIAKQTGDTTVRFVWDGDVMTGELRLEAKGDGEPVCTRVREWVYYPGSFEPLAMVQADGLAGENERIYYYANDPNGCPTRLLDENGKVVWAALYDAWGKVKKLPVDEVDQPLRLQGQYFDGETGLCYNRFRYYCPEIGAFVSADPLGLAAGKNLYSYAKNTWSFIDPLGLCKKGLGDATTSPWLNDPRTGVRMHLEEFRNGGSFLTTRKVYDKVIDGKRMIGYPDNTMYITKKGYMDKLFSEANGDIAVLEKRLGFDPGHFAKNGGLVRVDIKNPLLHNARMPSGLEMGANNHFKWGGYTSGGAPEAVINQVPNTDEFRAIKFLDW
jgi:RHS repeat-associated protein